MTRFLKSHEYARIEGNKAYIGISEYAARQLGVGTYVDMPDLGEEFDAGDDFGAIESRKAASDLFTPVSGEVMEINETLEEDPTLINKDPMANWIICIEMSDPSELDSLMDEAAYAAFCESLH